MFSSHSNQIFIFALFCKIIRQFKFRIFNRFMDEIMIRRLEIVSDHILVVAEQICESCAFKERLWSEMKLLLPQNQQHREDLPLRVQLLEKFAVLGFCSFEKHRWLLRHQYQKNVDRYDRDRFLLGDSQYQIFSHKNMEIERNYLIAITDKFSLSRICK